MCISIHAECLTVYCLLSKGKHVSEFALDCIVNVTLSVELSS